MKAADRNAADRHRELASDPYLKEQVEKMRGAAVLLYGELAAAPIDQMVQEVAFGIVTLETMPEIVQTHSGPLVVQRGTHGYQVLIRGAQLFPERMTPYSAASKNFVPLKPGPIVTGELS